MKLLEMFDRIMILNVPTRNDRRREMRKTLARIGVPPDDPRVAWPPGIDPRSDAGFGSPGVRGCFLSHLTALNMARNAGWRRVLILEDDCEFAPDFLDRQRAAADWLEATPWGIAYLGHPETHLGAPGLHLRDPREGLLLAHCYAVTGDVLPRLCPYLEAMTLRPPGSPEGGPMAFDGALGWFRRDHPDVPTVLVEPSLAYQRSSRSSLTPRWFDRLPILAEAASAARVIRRSIRGKARSVPATGPHPRRLSGNSPAG